MCEFVAGLRKLWRLCERRKTFAPSCGDQAADASQKVVPNVYYVEGVSEMGSSANQNFISNAGFVVTPAGVVVIDALGSPSLRVACWLKLPR